MAEFEAKQSAKAIDEAINAYNDMANVIQKDLKDLIDAVNRLKLKQKDQNFEAFQKAITPHQNKLGEISEKLKNISGFVEKDLKPKFLKYVGLEGEY